MARCCFRVCQALIAVLLRIGLVGAGGDDPVTNHHTYCVIGAGPAGLQLGWHLQEAKRDYVILEREDAAGSFFRRFPRHRKLISINKRFTGRTNDEFNLRHDWNSLLGHGGVHGLRFTNYSDDYFPSADLYLNYLADYATVHRLNVRYSINVTSIARRDVGRHRRSRFAVSTNNGGLIGCAHVVVATGLSKPHLPDIAGIELAVGYEDMSIDPHFYRNKSVLILGKQQSAFETANHIYGETAHVMMVSRGRPRLAWETHYVGDLRAINSQYLDAYQLKSLDTVIDSDLSPFGPFYRRPDGKIALWNTRGDQELFRTDDPEVFAFWDVVVRCTGWEMDQAIFADDTKPATTHQGKYPAMSGGFESSVPGLWIAGTLMHGNDWRRSSGGFIHGFRYLVRALSKILELQNHGMPWSSQSVSTRAALPSSIDAHRSSDQARRDYVELATSILRRSSEMSGPYQMFSVLMDVYVFSPDGSCRRFDEVPVQYMPTFLSHMNLTTQTELSSVSTGANQSIYIAVTFEYGKSYSGPGRDTLSSSRVVRPFPLASEEGPGSEGNFIHPVLYHSCYDKKSCQSNKKKVSVYHVAEDIHTTYLRPRIDIRPLADHLSQHDVLRYQELQYLQRSESSTGETCNSAPCETILSKVELEQMRMSQLVKVLDSLGATEQQIEEVIDHDTPKVAAVQQVVELQQARSTEPRADDTVSASDTDDDETAALLKTDSANVLAYQHSDCAANEIEIGPGECERIDAIDVLGQTEKARFSNIQSVPFLAVPFAETLEEIMPWLIEYVLERENEWLELPVSQFWDEADSSLTSRFANFNLLQSGRNEAEVRKLRVLQELIADSFLSFNDRWNGPRTDEEYGEAVTWSKFASSREWGNHSKAATGAWIECWANVHRMDVHRGEGHASTVDDATVSTSSSIGETKTRWRDFSYIKPHHHSFPYHGYISLQAQPSNTTFRSPHTKQIFSIEGQNGRLLLFPGGVRHTTMPWSNATHPRISIAFNIDLVPPGARIHCQIPLTMEYCRRETSRWENWSMLVGKDRVEELRSERKRVLVVREDKVTSLYGVIRGRL